MFKLGILLRKYLCFYCINSERKETEIIYKKITSTDYEDSIELPTEI